MMRIGQDRFFHPAPSLGAGARSGSDTAGGFDLTSLDPLKRVEKSEGDAWRGGQRDPIQAANDALALEFLEWAQKTPAEKIRERILDAKGLNEETLKDLPKAEREAIEAEIREAVKLAFGVKGDKGPEADTAKPPAAV